MTIIEKYITGGIVMLAILFGLVAYGYHLGDKAATEKYLPQIEKLKAAIDKADKEAKAIDKQHKENAHAIELENNARIARIRDYYNRLLQPVPPKGDIGSAPSPPKRTDGAGSEQTVTGCNPDFEQACVLDANKVGQWQEWAVTNKIPVSKP